MCKYLLTVTFTVLSFEIFDQKCHVVLSEVLTEWWNCPLTGRRSWVWILRLWSRSRVLLGLSLVLRSPPTVQRPAGEVNWRLSSCFHTRPVGFSSRGPVWKLSLELIWFKADWCSLFFLLLFVFKALHRFTPESPQSRFHIQIPQILWSVSPHHSTSKSKGGQCFPSLLPVCLHCLIFPTCHHF